MAITSRARKRLSILGVLIVLAVLGAIALIKFQQLRKDNLASEARDRGLQAAAEGRWEDALGDLNLAVARFPGDVETLVVFADVRARVASPNGQHLRFSLRLYTAALETANEQKADDDLKLKILRGLVKSHGTLGGITGSKVAAKGVLEIDPDDQDAILTLLSLSEVTGDLLPSDLDLVIRGPRTDEAWLADLREAQDESSLRWALELLRVEPSSRRRHETVLQILRLGESEAAQIAARGQVEETMSDVIDSWESEQRLEASGLLLLRARDLLARGEIARARESLESLSLEGAVTSAVDLLDLEDLLYNMGADGDREMARLILSRLGAQPNLDPAVCSDIMLRLWNRGRSANALEQSELTDGNPTGSLAEVDVVAAMIGLLDQLPERESLLARLTDPEIDRSELSSEFAQALDLIVRLASFLETPASNPSAVESALQEFFPSLNPNNPMLLTLIGDCFARNGDLNRAEAYYRRSSEADAGRSQPTNRRLVNLYLLRGNSREAFSAALRFFEAARTVEAALLFLTAWNDLGFLGIRGSDVEPNLAGWSGPGELADELQEQIGADSEIARGRLQFERARSVFLEGDFEAARSIIESEMMTQADAAQLFRLARFAEAANLDISTEALEKLWDVEVNPAQSVGRAILMAEHLASLGRIEEGLEVLNQSILDTEGQLRARALIARVRMLDPSSLKFKEGLESVLDLPLSTAQYRNLSGLAAEYGIEDIGFRLIQKARADDALDEVELVGLEGAYVLRFEREDRDSMLTAVQRIDKLLSDSGPSSRLASLLAKLLIVVSPGNPGPAIEILKTARMSDPDDVDLALVLVDLLQRDSRYEDAEDLLSTLRVRSDRLSSEERRRLSALLGRQGDRTATASTICELAAVTNSEDDLLRCLNAMLQASDLSGAADTLLRIKALERRSIAGEVAIADEFARQNQVDDGLGYLASTVGLMESIDSKLAIAEYAQRNGRFDRALAELRAGDAGVDSSARAQLVIATAVLSQKDREDRLELAVAAMERAESIGADDPKILRQLISLRLSDPALIETTARLIERLGESDPVSSEYLSFIRSEILTPAGARIPTELQSSAKRVLAARPESPLLWRRVIRLFIREFLAAGAAGDIGAQEQAAADARRIATGYVARFSKSVEALLQLCRVETMIRDLDGAQQTLAEIDRLALEDLSLSQLRQFVPCLVENKAWGKIIEVLDPYNEQIGVAEPNLRNALAAAFVEAGRFADSIDLIDPFSRSAEQLNDPLQDWLAVLRIVSPQAAIGVLQSLNDRDLSFDVRIAHVQLLLEKHRSGYPAETRSAITEGIRSLKAFEKTSSQAMLLRFIESEFLHLEGGDGIQRSCDGLLAEKPLIEEIMVFDELPQDRREEIWTSLNILVIMSNNLLAQVGDLDRAGFGKLIESKTSEAALLLADQLLEAIASENPEVLDSRASFYLVSGRLEDAESKIRQAIKMTPGRAAFRLTLARILSAKGLDVEASEELAIARRLSQFVDSTGLDARLERFADQDLTE